MQTQNEIRRLLAEAGLSPTRSLGQNFLIDRHHMDALLALADPDPDATVLEVGPGAGSLTEELLARVRRVVAVELDHGLAGLLRERLGKTEGFALVEGDALAGKHALNGEVLATLGPRAHLVANLPYSAATPIVACCLAASHRAHVGTDPGAVRFDRLTFTVQREVAQRLTARPGTKAYGPLAVLVAVLAEVREGGVIPPGAFWPRPKVNSQIVRLDYEPSRATELNDVRLLQEVCGVLFGQRRKQVGTIARKAPGPRGGEALSDALRIARIDPAARAETIDPAAWARLANALVPPA